MAKFIIFYLYIEKLKKRGVKRVINHSSCLSIYTIADIFFKHLKGNSRVLNLKNPVSAFMATVCWGNLSTSTILLPIWPLIYWKYFNTLLLSLRGSSCRPPIATTLHYTCILSQQKWHASC